MARPLRIELADTFYHVLNRGNERRAIFRDDKDCEGFLSRLGRCRERFELGVYAYILMGNHYHLVVRTSQANLSAAMHWLQGSYTVWHNGRHERTGHLFQGRFKAFLIHEDSYLQRLMLYVHRNPLRAGLVKHLRDYPWSSYHALTANRRVPPWFDPGLVYRQLEMDAGDLRRAIAGYDERSDDLWASLRHGLVLGSQSVVEALRRRLGPAKEAEKPQWRQLQLDVDVQEQIADYARRLQIDARADYEELLHPVRRRSRPRRDVLIYLLWTQGHHSLAEIAEAFHIRYAAASLAKARGESFLRANPRRARAWGITITP
jgi:putative transposase